MDVASPVVLCAVLRTHLQIVGQRPRPERRTDVHVPRQGGRAAISGELGGGKAVCLKIGAEAALLFRDTDGEEPFRVHVPEVLDRKARLAVVLSSARRQYVAPEPPGLVDQLGLRIAEPERAGCEDRGLRVMRIDILHVHCLTPAPAILPYNTSWRKAKIAASNCCGASRLARCPTPGKHA